MNSAKADLSASLHAKQLREECEATIPSRRGIEIILLSCFLAIFTMSSIYIWINGLIYDYWFYLLLGLILLIVIAGYVMDRKYSVDWKFYFLEILRELKMIDTVELSDYLNEGQPFLGANLGNCEKFLKIAETFKKREVIDIVIRGAKVYIKGYEPPEEEKESENEEKDA